MDKKNGKSENRSNHYEKGHGAERGEGRGKRRYPKPDTTRPYKNIEEYLSSQTPVSEVTEQKTEHEKRPEKGKKTFGRWRRRGKKEQENNVQKGGASFEQEVHEEAENKKDPHLAYTAAEEAEENTDRIEGRNSVTEAFRSGRAVDKLFVQEDLHDGPISSILRLAKKAGTITHFVSKERLNQLSETGRHQGVIANVAAYPYATIEDILRKAEEKGEDPFILLLDGIEDPHNLGAIIRTANMAGAHGVIIGKHRAAGLTAVVARASAGALNYTPVAKVTNLNAAIDRLKKDGMWFVCADMGGTSMYSLEMKGAVGLVIGNEGAGVSRLVKEKCDFVASIPTKGDIDSLNASVAAGVLAFEISRQRG